MSSLPEHKKRAVLEKLARPKLDALVDALGPLVVKRPPNAAGNAAIASALNIPGFAGLVAAASSPRKAKARAALRAEVGKAKGRFLGGGLGRLLGRNSQSAAIGKGVGGVLGTHRALAAQDKELLRAQARKKLKSLGLWAAGGAALGGTAAAASILKDRLSGPKEESTDVV